MWRIVWVGIQSIRSNASNKGDDYKYNNFPSKTLTNKIKIMVLNWKLQDLNNDHQPKYQFFYYEVLKPASRGGK